MIASFKLPIWHNQLAKSLNLSNVLMASQCQVQGITDRYSYSSHRNVFVTLEMLHPRY